MKQEKFVRFIAFDGLSPVPAYQRAFDCVRKSARARAYKLLNNPSIQKRLTILLQEAGRRNEVTIDEVITNLRKAIRGAEAEGDWNAMISGAKHLGLYLGMFEGKEDKRSAFNEGESEAETQARLERISRLSHTAIPADFTEVNEDRVPATRDEE